MAALMMVARRLLSAHLLRQLVSHSDILFSCVHYCNFMELPP